VVIANSWVDATFLDEADQARHLAMAKFQGELRQIDTLSRQKQDATAQLEALRPQRSKLQAQQVSIERELSGLATKLRSAEQEVQQQRQKAGRLCQISELSPSCTDAVKAAISKREKIESRQQQELENLEANRQEVEQIEEQMTCLTKEQRGENCSFWDSLPDAPNTAMLRQKLDEINANLSDFAENSINLLVSLLLKTVAIPLLFLYLLLKIARMNWSRL
jgi:DNA repair exonuclease SbcCD ATPase subunit